jgi:hypothetical protein
VQAVLQNLAGDLATLSGQQGLPYRLHERTFSALSGGSHLIWCLDLYDAPAPVQADNQTTFTVASAPPAAAQLVLRDHRQRPAPRALPHTVARTAVGQLLSSLDQVAALICQVPVPDPRYYRPNPRWC